MDAKKSEKKKYQFIADQMLGRLSKWLRLLGYDTIYLNPAFDSELIKIAKEQNRILLTRDTHLMKRRAIKKGWIRAVLIKEDHLGKQLKELAQVVDLHPRKFLEAPFCPECNFPLKKVPKNEVKTEVPAYVYQTQKQFSRCDLCKRYYWQGTHWQRIQAKLDTIFKQTEG